jgi:ubiquinone/menaquinone biosynthesis C-methylase UbiE
MSQTEADTQLTQLLEAYYTDYYRDQLGLPDWQTRVANRLNEVTAYGNYLIENFERWFNLALDENWHVLVVGAGTGAEYLSFARRGCKVIGIEPNPDAVQISRLRASQAGYDPDTFQHGIGEQIQYPDQSFDLVWCHTVLEHVQDVQATIREMIRVLKPGGYAYIMTPDYRQFHEPHYKLPMPMFFPKWMLKIYLSLIGRPAAFLDTLQFVNSRQLSNTFQNYPVIAFQVYHSWPESWKKKPDFQQKVIMKLTKWFSWQRDQYWVLKKLDHIR